MPDITFLAGRQVSVLKMFKFDIFVENSFFIPSAILPSRVLLYIPNTYTTHFSAIYII